MKPIKEILYDNSIFERYQSLGLIDTYSFEQRIIDKDFIDRWILTLKPKYRFIVAMYFRGYKITEICDLLKQTKQAIYQDIKKIQRVFVQYCYNNKEK